MYDYAWRPFFFSMAKDPAAKGIFARALTYLVLLMLLIFLVVSFFVGDIVRLSVFGRHVISPNYWSGLAIVPVVLLGYLFFGMYINLSAGIYIEKKTYYLPAITFLGAVVNVIANFLLIPSGGIMGGMMGAAWATLFAYLAMAVAVYFVAQRVYPVRYEWGRLLKLAIAGAGVVLIYSFVPLHEQATGVLFKLTLLAGFLGLMYLLKFFDPREVDFLKSAFQKIRPVPPADPPGEPPLEEP
jgi:O-antigen/teichoic acid export membrane protein